MNTINTPARNLFSSFPESSPIQSPSSTPSLSGLTLDSPGCLQEPKILSPEPSSPDFGSRPALAVSQPRALAPTELSDDTLDCFSISSNLGTFKSPTKTPATVKHFSKKARLSTSDISQKENVDPGTGLTAIQPLEFSPLEKHNPDCGGDMSPPTDSSTSPSQHQQQRAPFTFSSADRALPKFHPIDYSDSFSETSTDSWDSHSSLSSQEDFSLGMFDTTVDLLLPTIPKNAGCSNLDCNRITPETVGKLLRGDFSDKVSKFFILDCRYPYEFDGGHISTAINMMNPNDVESMFMHQPMDESTVIILHCEFSTKRAPKMYRHLRGLDRQAHADTYPELYYPNIFLLEGGYRHFFESQKEHCSPSSYVEMNDTRFTAELKHNTSALRKMWKKRKAGHIARDFRALLPSFS